jgi:hypothetical protein
MKAVVALTPGRASAGNAKVLSRVIRSETSTIRGLRGEIPIRRWAQLTGETGESTQSMRAFRLSATAMFRSEPLTQSQDWPDSQIT